MNATTLPVNEPGLHRALRENIGWVIGAGWVMVIVGIISTLAPLASALTLTIAIGALLIIGGAGELFIALRTPASKRGLLVLLPGVVCLLFGIFLVWRPRTVLAAMALVFAAYFIATGILSIIAAFRLRPLPRWGWLLLNGLLTLALGAMILKQWPLSGAWAIGVLF